MNANDVCEECLHCWYYWENNDTGDECEGEKTPCHEFMSVPRGYPTRDNPEGLMREQEENE